VCRSGTSHASLLHASRIVRLGGVHGICGVLHQSMQTCTCVLLAAYAKKTLKGDNEMIMSASLTLDRRCCLLGYCTRVCVRLVW